MKHRPPASEERLGTDRARALRLVPVSRETADRLDRYVDLLRQWQRATNLIAQSTVDEIWTRHVADSLQLVEHAPTARTWLDLGSGGGFPGIVIACALADQPDVVVDLVERNAKKAAFLREALRVTGAPGRVHLSDIGDYVDKSAAPVDCITARALAPLKVLCAFIAPRMAENTIALLMKGQDIEAELTEASKYWKITSEKIPSLTSGQGTILKISRLQPA